MKNPIPQKGVGFFRDRLLINISMASLTINDKIYDIDLLPDEAKAQITSIQFVDTEIARISALLAALQTARIGYLKALAPYLDASGAIKQTLQ